MTVQMVTSATGTSLQRLAEAAWQRTGEGSQLYFEDQHWTGPQLADRSRRLSGGLREAGLQPGERVVICMANCPEVGISYHAIWRAGGVTTPVLFLLSTDELRHVLTDSGAVLVITTPEFLAKVTAAAAGVASVRGIVVVGPAAAGDGIPLLSFADLEAAAPAPLIDADPASLAALLYTGGTTGRSKGVMISHNALSASSWAALATSYDPALTSVLVPLPLSHVYGLMINAMQLHAIDPGTTVLMRWFDPAGWLPLMAGHRVTTSAVVPSMLQMLLQQPLEDYDLSALVRINSGAAPLSAQVADDLERRLPGVEIAEGYGCTETAAIIATSPIGGARRGSRRAPGPRRRPADRAAGRHRGGTRRGGRDLRGRPAGDDRLLELAGGDEQALRGGYLHTGDVGRLDGDGYLYIVDRIKDLIIRGGYNVYPRDVEDVLIQHPDVVAAAVVGRPDPKYGEEVVAFVQLRDGAQVTAGRADRVRQGAPVGGQVPARGPHHRRDPADQRHEDRPQETAGAGRGGARAG